MKKAKKKAPAKKAVVTLRDLVAAVSALEARMAEAVGAIEVLDQRTARVATDIQAALENGERTAKTLSDRVTTMIRRGDERRAALEPQVHVMGAEIARLQQALEVAEVDARRWRASQAIAEQ